MNDDQASKEIASILGWFKYNHLPDGLARETSMRFYNLAWILDADLDNDPELVIALRKLLEAKDAAVRAAIRTNSPA